jgi:hypothetical protein
MDIGTTAMKTAAPVYAFVTGLLLVALGLVAVPITVAALDAGLPISCTPASYDPGYGVSPSAATPSCSVIAQR